MCYSLKTSLISFILGITSAIFAIATKQYILGFLILFYSQMQLSELLIWYGIDNNNEKINEFGTSFGKYSLATHNIGIALGILFAYYAKEGKLELSNFLPLLFSLAFFLIIVVVFYLPNNYPSTTYQYDPTCATEIDKCQNNNNRLNWLYPTQWYIYSFLISITLSIIYIRPIKSALFLNGFFILTFLLFLFYINHVFQSLWCFYAAILAPILVIVNYYLSKDDESFFT